MAEPVKRTTEGSREGAVARGHRGPGRPKGSRNKPKSLIPAELAETILLRMEQMLPPEQFSYLRGVIKEGKAVSTKQELDTIILLLSRNLYPALIQETIPAEEGGLGGIYRRDVTDRLKVLASLLSLRNQIDKRDDAPKDEGNRILTIAADRGIDLSRVRVLVGIEPGGVGGNADGTGRRALPAGSLPDSLPERPMPVHHREQESSDWVLDGVCDEGGLEGDDEGGDEG